MDYKKNINHSSGIPQKAVSMETFTNALPKKCERIATAIYLVTNFLSDNEPMKSRLRTLSIEFVRDSSLLKNIGHKVETNVLNALSSNITETLSLLELSLVSGLISEMNFTVLKREYLLLKDNIEIKKASHESQTDNILGDTFFGSSFRVGEHYLNQNPSSSSTKVGTHNNSFSSSQNSRTQYLSSAEKKSFKMSDRKNEEGVFKSKTIRSARATTNVLKDSRRTRIVKLVKDNQEVSIKDITNHFTDLSEKTIQRELVALVAENVLKKIGERRWSKYILA